MRSSKFVPAILTCLLALLVAQAAELKSDYKEGAQRQDGRRIVPPPLPPPTRNPIADLVGRCEVLDGHHYRGLTVFPIQVRGYGVGISPLTLDEALAQGAVAIMEKGAGQVPVLVVENRGPQFVFIMSGEILVGGRQNRILREDVLLPPNSGPIELPAYCVEEGRWVKTMDGFKSDGNLASSVIRLHAQKSAEQSAIWGGIAETAKELGQQSPSGDFNRVYRGEVARGLADYRGEFFRVIPREIIGFVVARNGQFIGADLFGNASLCYRLRNKAMDSYAIDALGREGSPGPIPDREAARQFLLRVFSAPYYTQATPGAGMIGRAVGNGIDAKGLIWSDRVVHVSIFSAVTIMPTPIRRLE